jgi:hypothetical protein
MRRDIVLSHVHDRQDRTMGQGWELSISNLESARGEQVWLMAREEQCTAAAGRPGAKASLELVVRRALPVP